MALEAVSQTFLTSVGHKSVQDVFSKPTATLATVKKYLGAAKMMAVVESLIKRVAAFLNIGRGMNEIQVQMTAEMIFSEYYWLTVADLKVCFRNGMAGNYGQLYDRLDGMVIMDWLRVYSEERASIAEQNEQKKHGAQKHSETATGMPEWLSEKIREMDAKKKQFFEGKQSSVKYSSLAAFMQAIGRDTDGDRRQLMEIWENEYVVSCPELELDAWMLYQSANLLFRVNIGEVATWEDIVKAEPAGEWKDMPF